MAQSMVNFRMDSELKKGMEQTCKEMGMSMTTAFTIFATKINRDKKFPFEIEADPFYSVVNQERIMRGIKALDAGLGVEHELIEATND